VRGETDPARAGARREEIMSALIHAVAVRSEADAACAGARREEVVQVLPSNTVEELEANVERTVAWLKQAAALRC